MNDTTRPALAASTALSAPAEPPRGMIDLVLEHAEAMAAFAKHGGNPARGEEDTYWTRYEAACEAIHDAPCRSIEDMLAKIQAAKLELRSSYPDSVPPERRQDETEMLAHSPAGRWAWEICLDMLRLFVGQPQPTTGDEQLLALAAEFIEISKQEKGLYGEGEYAAMRIPDEKARCPLLRAIWDRQEEIMDQLADLRAKTPAGLVARVRMADAEDATWRRETTTEDLGAAIAFDLAEDVLAMFGEVAGRAPRNG